MIDVKTELLTALKNNTALIALLGGQRIYQLVAPIAGEFPRVTFFELTNFDSEWADDSAIASEIHIQVDIWSHASTTSIAQQVDVTLKSLGYQRTSGADLYEIDDKIYHKALRYMTTRSL